MKVKAVKSIKGKVVLPGDKSISHRAALLAAIAEGETRIENFASSADCASTLACLRKLGVEIFREKSDVYIKGVGKRGFRKSPEMLDCGNSGTTVRLLSGILAGQSFESVLVGDESLLKRPMKRIIEPLTRMGARIESCENRLPLRIFGKSPLQSITYKMPTASAQVKSCILLAGLLANGKTSVIESFQSETTACEINPDGAISITRDHTERMLKWFGVKIDEKQTELGNVFSIDGREKLIAKNLRVPSDISSAAFFLIAASCLKGSEISIKNVGLNPTRTAVIEVLQRFGANIEVINQSEICNEPIGDLRISGNEKFALSSGENKIDGKIISNLIDEIPVLAILGTQVEGGLEVRHAQELRVKESDRIKAVVENLRRMNAEVEEFTDGFRVKKSKLKGAKIDSFGDHRIAMAFAVAALLAEGETEIIGAECVNVSFPEFFEILESVKS
jgi:3-phosphoshikimate 1-carboxyvinyltransferase